MILFPHSNRTQRNAMQRKMVACLAECHEAPISEAHDFVGVPLELVLDESKEVFLIHAGRVVYVSVHLEHNVEKVGAKNEDKRGRWRQ